MSRQTQGFCLRSVFFYPEIIVLISTILSEDLILLTCFILFYELLARLVFSCCIFVCWIGLFEIV